MTTSIVIPVYNEQDHIERVIEGIRKIEKSIPIVIVDDGSTDSTFIHVRKAMRKYEGLAILRHKVNLGKGAAMKTGAIYAFSNNNDAIVFMDADGQHSPKDIVKFLNKMKGRRYDLVFGVRKVAKDVPFIRGYGNKIGIAIVYLLFGIKVSDLLCGFRAISKDAWEKLNLTSTGYGIETEMVAKTAINNIKFTQVVVETIYHDKTKGVTILHAFAILIDVIRWRLTI